MVDFRSSGERDRDRHNANRVEQDYKRAFEEAQSEVARLKSKITELESHITAFKGQVTELATTQAENTRSLRSQLEAGLAKLDEDNRQMHAMIKSAHNDDLKLVEQMDQNHRERLESIVRLVDQKGLS